jgi:hypothetical protein
MTKLPLSATRLALGVALGLALGASVHSEDAGQAPRTAAGHPNFQGQWTSGTVVPLERPRELGDREFLTQEEAEKRLAAALVVEETEPGTAADVHYQLVDFGLDRSQNPVVTSLRTSIITDPPNGRLPEATPEAKAAADARAAYRRAHGFDSAQDRPLAERCIVWPHEGPPTLPVGYNSNVQIMQTDDNLVFLIEMLHDARIIPLDAGSTTAGIPQWLGSSRGRWEGDTLVVETTDFSGKTGRGDLTLSPTARVTERLTLTDANTILYQFTVDDPKTWTQPWSGEYPMTRIDGPMFEYACHEGNYGLAHNLSGARAEEKAAAEAAAGQR